MPIPADFRAVLVLLGRAFMEYHRVTGSQAILVGGSVVTILTGGQYLSGDFDVLAGLHDEFHGAMAAQGFQSENRSGRLKRGWYHPSFPSLGIETVSNAYFDGLADPKRIRPVKLGPDSQINIAPVEDMIADRLGQYASNTNDKGPLKQAQLLVKLAQNLDRDYLEKRVKDEQGDLSALDGL